MSAQPVGIAFDWRSERRRSPDRTRRCSRNSARAPAKRWGRGNDNARDRWPAAEFSPIRFLLDAQKNRAFSSANLSARAKSFPLPAATISTGSWRRTKSWQMTMNRPIPAKNEAMALAALEEVGPPRSHSVGEAASKRSSKSAGEVPNPQDDGNAYVHLALWRIYNFCDYGHLPSGARLGRAGAPVPTQTCERTDYFCRHFSMKSTNLFSSCCVCAIDVHHGPA